MTRYAYLVASLPSLAGDPATARVMTLQRFRALCSEHLEPADLAELDAVLAGAGRSSFAARWRRADTTIKNACARTRAERLGVDATPMLREVEGLDLTLTERAQSACKVQDPALRELRLDELRVAVLRELAFPTPFDLPAVLAYALEIAIVERRRGRDRNAGRADLDARIEALLRLARASRPDAT